MARNLMIQGTMSGAGNFRVAPFKSQNMALNSFVTRDGLEMGRAQVVQAAAAGLEPSADMNPILLKPMGDAVSEVIVNGGPIGKMRAADYYRVKKSLVPQILEAYHRLEEQAEIIVIEGAGSPVEINLREGDFVNMGLAQMVDAPVLLAGNIDPGGVFAQLLGTVQLMRPEERERVKGLIINKFRGDVRLLEPGLSMFREYCDIPFAGIVPWLKLNLDEEDSLSDKLTGGASLKSEQKSSRPADSPNAAEPVTVDIAVIRLPYMSNYTDFAPLEQEEGVNLDAGSDSSARHPQHDRRPSLAQKIGAGEMDRQTGQSSPRPERRTFEHAGRRGVSQYVAAHGHLRRLPDAGKKDSGPVSKRGGRRGGRTGSSAHRNSVPAGKTNEAKCRKDLSAGRRLDRSVGSSGFRI